MFTPFAESVPAILAKRPRWSGQTTMNSVVPDSGESRVSNFMLWQAAYAEFVFLDVLWPDFSAVHLRKALEEFSRRERRFGLTASQLDAGGEEPGH